MVMRTVRTTKPTLPAAAMRGTTMIEVLVTIVILAFGLLGLAGLEARLQQSELEAYQRAQALVLLNDMANRIEANRKNVASYVTGPGSPVGFGRACPVPTNAGTLGQTDTSQWCNALQGGGELSGAAKVGALVGGRGCVEALGNNEYLLTVTWQGVGPISAPPLSVACGKDSYNGGPRCTLDLCRRVVTTIVRVGSLS